MLALDPLNAEFENRSAEEIIMWAYTTFAPDIVMSCSFQMQSLPLLHLVACAAPQLPILFLDTGYHFSETLAFRDRLVREWKLNLQIVRSDISPVEFTRLYGPELYRRDPDLCCYINKVRPMEEALHGRRAWISGIRRDQSRERANTRVLERTPDGVLRVQPMVRWTRADIAQYIQVHRLPEHPLHARGYKSIGCAPCTQPVQEGEDERAGRWAGWSKNECGLHTDLRQDTPASAADAGIRVDHPGSDFGREK